MTFKTNAVMQQEAADAERRAQEARCLADIYRATPTLIRNEANGKLIMDDLKRFIANDDDPPTLSWWELMVAANPSYIQTRLATTTEVVRKEALVDTIMTLLRDHGPRMSEFDLANEKKRLSLPGVSVQELEDRLAQIKERQRLAGMSVAQIQKEIAEKRQQSTTRVVLPLEFTVRTIKSMGVDSLKNLIRTYGTAAVNDRLFGRS